MVCLQTHTKRAVAGTDCHVKSYVVHSQKTRTLKSIQIQIGDITILNHFHPLPH